MVHALGPWVAGAGAVVVSMAVAAAMASTRAGAVQPAAAVDSFVLDHTMKRIDGTEEDLNSYKGKVVLIVNTASKCGLTPQYEGLEKLYREKKDRGLVILGFPANDFREQEPGTNEEIATFCREKYDVTFPMFQKIVVTGEQKHKLYDQLTKQAEPIGGELKWNFTKFLVDREGRVVARFEPRTTPEDAEFLKKVEELLGEEKKPAEGGQKGTPAGA